MISRRIGFVFLGLAVVLAMALGLWLGAFDRQEAEATPPLEDLTVVVSSVPASGTVMAAGSVVTYTVAVTADGPTSTADVPLSIDLSGLTLIGASLSPGTGITCVAGDPIACTVTTVFAAASSRSVTFQATVSAGGPALVGAVLDTPIDGTGEGTLDEEGNDAGVAPLLSEDTRTAAIDGRVKHGAHQRGADRANRRLEGHIAAAARREDRYKAGNRGTGNTGDAGVGRQAGAN